MKTCFKCGKVKDLTCFYRHPETKDGYLGKCKECAREYALEYRFKNIKKARAYDRGRNSLPHRLSNRRVGMKAYRKSHPIQIRAMWTINNDVRYGKIVRPHRCQACKTRGRIVGHHPDYDKPREVVWLCQICHSAEHKRLNLMS